MKDGTQWKDGRKLKVCAFDFRVSVIVSSLIAALIDDGLKAHAGTASDTSSRPLRGGHTEIGILCLNNCTALQLTHRFRVVVYTGHWTICWILLDMKRIINPESNAAM